MSINSVNQHFWYIITFLLPKCFLPQHLYVGGNQCHIFAKSGKIYLFNSLS